MRSCKRFSDSSFADVMIRAGKMVYYDQEMLVTCCHITCPWIFYPEGFEDIE